MVDKQECRNCAGIAVLGHLEGFSKIIEDEIIKNDSCHKQIAEYMDSRWLVWPIIGQRRAVRNTARQVNVKTFPITAH